MIAENVHAIAFRDGYPVTEGHTLIISRRHTPGFFDLSSEEVTHAMELISQVRDRMLMEDSSIDGFNIGVNVGEAAGQTVPHCHIHLIPRRLGDVEKPRGGVRHIIPGKGDY